MLLLLLACKQPDQAPEDLDALFHWFWTHYDTGTDEELRAGGANLAPLIEAASQGLVTNLDKEEQDLVELDQPGDPAEATGVYVAGPMACTLEDLEAIYSHVDQEELFESATGRESYDAYERHYTSDFDAYMARTTPFLTWVTTYTVTPVLSTYTAVIDGGMRFIPAGEEGESLVVQRSVLPAPATFEGNSNDFFEQDYQLDIIIPVGSAAAHAYVTWRDLQSAGLEDESNGVQNILLDGLEDYDRDTEVVCAIGGF